MIELSSYSLREFIMTTNSRSEKNDVGKCLVIDWPVTSYGSALTVYQSWGLNVGSGRSLLKREHIPIKT